MKYSLMSFMVDAELKHTKTNFILYHILKDCGVKEVPENADKAYEMLNGFGIPLRNGTATFEDLVKFTRENGFDGLDMMHFQMELPGKEIRAIMEKYGVTLSSVNVIIPFSEAADEKEFEKMYQEACEAVDQACEAGCEKVLFVPGGYMLPEGATREQTYQNMVSALKKVSDYADSKGITFSTETLESSSVPYCSCGEMLRIFAEVPGLMYTHDTGNPLIANEDPAYLYETFKDRVVSVHFKELGYTEEKENAYHCMNGKYMECVPFGEGEVDFRGHLQLLKKNNYDGYITLEGGIPAENKWEEAIAALNYFRNMEKDI